MAQPIDKAFKIMKNKQFANMGPSAFRNIGGTPSTRALNQRMGTPLRGPAQGDMTPNELAPQQAPMPNQQELQEMLLQMAQEKLANPTYLQNMMEILNKPEGMDFARAAKREYENSMNPQANVDEDTY